MSVASWCSTSLCRSVCWFFYGPFCHGALNLDIATLFTTLCQFVISTYVHKHAYADLRWGNVGHTLCLGHNAYAYHTQDIRWIR